MSSDANTASKAAVNLGVPVADQVTKPAGPVSEGGHEIAGLLGHPPGRRVLGDTEDVDPPDADLHHEQHVKSA